MTREHALELLESRYSHDDVQAYVARAEEQQGEAYWALIPDNHTLLADMARFLQAQQLEVRYGSSVR